MSFATSVTKVELYHNCTRRYLYEVVLGDKKPPTMAMYVGDLYHKVLAKIARAKYHEVENPDPQLALSVTIEGVLNDEEEGLASNNLKQDDLQEEIYLNLQRLQSMWAPSKLWPLEIAPNQPLVERSFWRNSLGYNGKIDIGSENTPITTQRGSIKGWLKEPCVVDFKILTGKRRKTERDARVSPQLALYAAEVGLSRAAYVEIPRNLEKPIQVRTVEYDPQEMRWWRKWLEQQSGHLRIMYEIADKWKKSVDGDTLEAFEKNPLALGMMYENFPQCLRSNALCSDEWCPHYDRCYPYEQTSEVSPSAEA